jgi:hypothetical protein
LISETPCPESGVFRKLSATESFQKCQRFGGNAKFHGIFYAVILCLRQAMASWPLEKAMRESEFF